MHTHRECPSCGRLLVWFKQDDDSPLDPGWRIDENEERIQRYRKGGD